ncbi:prostaglandin reductase 3-like [Branchiostoma floridae x Branchiostoma japonicum]
MAQQLPKAFQRLMVSSLTPKFRNAISIETVPMMKPGPKEVVVKNRFVGINASDVNLTAGRYDPTKVPPFEAGFEVIVKSQ